MILQINWVNKIKALFDEAYEPVNDDLNLDIISPNYIKNLLSLLDNTSNRTIRKFRKNNDNGMLLLHTLIRNTFQ